MIITIELHSEKLCHMAPHQFGAFVAHVMGLKNFKSVECFTTAVRVSFTLGEDLGIAVLVDQAKLQQQLQSDLEALVNLDPMPCPCGCGAYLSISPCHVQSGLNLKHGLTKQEIDLAVGGNKIGAVKEVRTRTSLGLKDAKDLVENFCHSLPSTHPAYYPKALINSF